MKKFVISVLATVLTVGMINNFTFALTLTSLTLDAQNALGQTLNAPGGIYSTNLGDPLAQLGVMSSDSVFLNNPGNGLDLGEIAINLQPGVNTFELFGNFVLSGNGYSYYGLSLFFDNIATPPQIAVYNQNGGTGDFLVQPKDTIVVGSANGGLFFDNAPGTLIYHALDGSSVEVLAFKVGPLSTGTDRISWGNIGSDGHPDLTAELTLKYSPVPEPGTMLLVGIGLVALVGIRKRITI